MKLRIGPVCGAGLGLLAAAHSQEPVKSGPQVGEKCPDRSIR